MDIDEILQYCLKNLQDTVLVNSWGEKGVFYNPNNTLKRGVYILTVKEKNGENDKGSNLDRKNIYRLNLGVKKSTFIKMFGFIPKRPLKGGIVEMKYDFTSINQILPHPVYAWMGWICILNPDKQKFEDLKILIQEAYDKSKEKYSKRKI